MPDTLTRTHPLSLPAREQGPDSSAITLIAEPPLTLLDIRCREKAKLNAFLKTPIGLRSPAVARAATNAEGTLSRLGPNWWQLRWADRKMAARLVEKGVNGPVGVTDISDAYLAICIEGPRARSVLAKASTIDLHPDNFAVGSVARTLFGRVTVVISNLQSGDTPAFDVLISRSNARFLWRWLADASREYGFTLVPAGG